MWSKVCYPVAKISDFANPRYSATNGVPIDSNRQYTVVLNSDLSTLYARIEFGRSDDRMNSNYQLRFSSGSTDLYLGTTKKSEIKDVTLGNKTIGAMYIPFETYQHHQVLKFTIKRGTSGYIKIQADDNPPFTYTGSVFPDAGIDSFKAWADAWADSMMYSMVFSDTPNIEVIGISGDNNVSESTWTNKGNGIYAVSEAGKSIAITSDQLTNGVKEDKGVVLSLKNTSGGGDVTSLKITTDDSTQEVPLTSIKNDHAIFVDSHNIKITTA